ncbi:hypothetical protein DPMN_109881 [Dreissena polymorpha]|uniref:Uncharacterized protein n=1 Tax=Dreissena polymorpha TaxID=45954 RepID=A0A9D4KB24_DREPO|nr:hypothetical protein DPMN_109881 [Dreissena polymorpha]
MALFKLSKTRNVPFLVDGAVHTMKGVTKSTTCDEVIAKLITKQDPNMAVFLRVHGVAKELQGKSKILKVIQHVQSYETLKNVELIIKNVENIAKTSAKQITDCDQSHVKQGQYSIQRNSSRLSRESIKKISDLAFYVRYQMKKVQLLKNTEKSNAYNVPRNKSHRLMTSHASTNSMDAFLAKIDLDEMSHFLNFCERVAQEKLEKGTLKGRITKELEAIKRQSSNRRVYLQRKPTPSNKQPTRSTSTGTIESTDTGYSSVGSETETQVTVACKTESIAIKPCRVQIEDDSNVPRHSTPVASFSHIKRVKEMHECTLSEQLLKGLNELHGKSVIMERFIADQTCASSSTVVVRKSMPFDDVQNDTWVGYNELQMSDSADVTRHSEIVGPRKMRRESAFTNLNKCTSSTRFSLCANPQVNRSSQFDYSFNCSFPLMDEHQSIDFTYSFTETDTSDVIDEVIRAKSCKTDEIVNYYKRRNTSVLGEDLNITKCEKNIFEANIISVDEDAFLIC